MATSARFTIPLPPSANNLFANSPKGRVKTVAYRAWIDEAGKLMRMVQRVPRVSGEVSVSITMRRVKGADLDNRLKPCLDLMVACGAIDDDSNVVEIIARYGAVDGVDVFVRRVEPATVAA